MTEREYRQDDQTVGYCPLCGRVLSGLTGLLRGYCEVHGWTFADFTPIARVAEVEKWPTAKEEE
jgi:hypothetical protein